MIDKKLWINPLNENFWEVQEKSKHLIKYSM